MGNCSPKSRPPPLVPPDTPRRVPPASVTHASHAASSLVPQWRPSPSSSSSSLAPPPAAASAPASASASPRIASSSSSSSPIVTAMPHDAIQLAGRLKGVLLLQQRLQLGRPLLPKDRGQLMGALQLLYHGEEQEATSKLAKEKEKKRAQAAEAAAAAADTAAMVALFTEPGSMADDREEDADEASLLAAAQALVPPSLPADCSVCYSSFGSEWEGRPVVRFRASLCGHAGLCADCFSQYLRKRVEADDVMPFIPCPEPGCKLPLSHFDLGANVPTLAAHQAWEAAHERSREEILRRNEKALERKRQRRKAAAAAACAEAQADVAMSLSACAASSAAHTSDEDHTPPSARGARSGARKLKARSRRRHSSATSNSSAEEEEQAEKDAVPIAPPIAPAVAAAPVEPLLPTPVLLQLTLLHLHKALLQCRNWLPCGTHPLGAEEEEKEETPSAIPATDLALSASSVSPAEAEHKSADPSAPAPAAAPSAPPCRFGFVIAPAWSSKFKSSPSKDKLKKCEACGVLQCVRPKEAEGGATDDAVAAMLADGTLRPCPQCDALQMKDQGMCNVMQCHSCQIWWNWSSRVTGKNPAALKDLARRTGSMWEPGELAYQLRLQREDPEAFKDLLKRNGIDYNPNYVRGMSN